MATAAPPRLAHQHTSQLSSPPASPRTSPSSPSRERDRERDTSSSSRPPPPLSKQRFRDKNAPEEKPAAPEPKKEEEFPYGRPVRNRLHPYGFKSPVAYESPEKLVMDDWIKPSRVNSYQAISSMFPSHVNIKRSVPAIAELLTTDLAKIKPSTTDHPFSAATMLVGDSFGDIIGGILPERLHGRDWDQVVQQLQEKAEAERQFNQVEARILRVNQMCTEGMSEDDMAKMFKNTKKDVKLVPDPSKEPLTETGACIVIQRYWRGRALQRQLAAREEMYERAEMLMGGSNAASKGLGGWMLRPKDAPPKPAPIVQEEVPEVEEKQESEPEEVAKRALVIEPGMPATEWQEHQAVTRLQREWRLRMMRRAGRKSKGRPSILEAMMTLRKQKAATSSKPAAPDLRHQQDDSSGAKPSKESAEPSGRRAGLVMRRRPAIDKGRKGAGAREFTDAIKTVFAVEVYNVRLKAANVTGTAASIRYIGCVGIVGETPDEAYDGEKRISGSTPGEFQPPENPKVIYCPWNQFVVRLKPGDRSLAAVLNQRQELSSMYVIVFADDGATFTRRGLPVVGMTDPYPLDPKMALHPFRQRLALVKDEEVVGEVEVCVT